MAGSAQTLEKLANREYEWGFVTEIEADQAPPGLNEDIIRLISGKKNEPEWLLAWRLRAYKRWLEMPEPEWSM
ncbi:MAG TPA: Fe-S cluster assembly protein SufB, partial [Myxococcota bacterium]|nr:Fe-S cluster assembly protein SufB [Myxococcota bacterium]